MNPKKFKIFFLRKNLFARVAELPRAEAGGTVHNVCVADLFRRKKFQNFEVDFTC